MIAANDYIDPMLPKMSPVQLRMLIAQAAGLLAWHDPIGTRRSLVRIAMSIPVPDDMMDIARAVAARRCVTVDQLRGPSHREPLVHYRHELMWELRQACLTNGSRRFSFPRIGLFMGGRDHTTIIHGVRAHQQRLDRRARAAA